MRVKFTVKSIQGALLLSGAVDCGDSVADCLKTLGPAQTPTDTLDRCTLYYNGRKVSRKSKITDAFPDCADVVLLAVPKKGHVNNSRKAPTARTAAQDANVCPTPVESAANAQDSDLVYGRAHGGQDTLLPGFVSRPHPSPTNRLVQAKQAASPVPASALQPHDALASHAKQLRRSKRKLVFDGPVAHDQVAPAHQVTPTTTADPTAPQTAAAGDGRPPLHDHTDKAIQATGAATSNRESRTQSPAQGIPTPEDRPPVPHDQQPPAPVPELGTPTAKPASKEERSWGCSLFAPRVTKVVEDAMQHMPLPEALAVYDRLFAALSALCLWLKKNGVQASWLTVRDSLRDVFKAEGMRVTAEHVLRLSQLCPLLVEVGQDRPWHASWAAKRRGAAPDAAEVAKRAQDTGAQDAQPECGPGEAGDRAARAAGAAVEEEKPSLQQLQCAVAACGADGAAEHAAGGHVATRGVRSTVQEQGAEPAAGAAVGATYGRAGGVIDMTGPDWRRQDVLSGTDFAIRLQDAPRHVPFAEGKAASKGVKASRKKRAAAKGEERQAPPAVQQVVDAAVAAAEAQPRTAAAQGAAGSVDAEAGCQAAEAGKVGGTRNDAGQADGQQDGPQKAGPEVGGAAGRSAAGEELLDGDPAFTPGSYYARHFCTFRRCTVQAVALLHEVALAPVQGVSLQERMATLLQELLPAPAVGPPVKGAAAKSEPPAPHKAQGRFGSALRTGEWAPPFSAADVSLDAISAAADALMAHWSVIPDDEAEGSVAALCHIHTHRNKPPCLDTTPLSAAELLDHLQASHNYEAQVVHVERMPARAARYGALPFELHPPVRAALARCGIQPAQLFCHQVEAITALLQRRHVAVCTSTASGKSLCYLVPILQSLAEDPEACALFMFPTKALAQDQRAALQRMLAAAFPTDTPPVDVYDGDTPQEARAAIRTRARLLVTNPDMLHQSMLPVHGQFHRFLANLRYVVVDEGHMYKGAFGCHVSAVLRRLRRICAREFAREPVFAVTSATSAQPQQHVCALLGVLDVHVVSDDGSPHGPRLFTLWNPPLTAGKAGGAPLPAGAGKLPPRPGLLSHTESRVRSLELRRAKQEAVRQAMRARNAARTGSTPLGQGTSSEQWRQHTAIGRKRNRASGHDAPSAADDPAANPGDAPAQTATAAINTHTAPGTAPDPRAPDASPAAAADGHTCEPGVKSAAACGAPATPRGDNSTLTAAPADLAQLQGPVGAGAAKPVAAAEGVVAVQRPRQSAARAREVQVLLDSVGGSSRRPPQSNTIVVGDKRGCAALPQSVRDEIQQHLSEAAAADKAKSVEGRYGAAGVALEQKRRSPILEIALLLAECVQHGLRTIAFCKTRKVCELVTSYTRDVLRETAPLLAARLAVYRSGYSAAERRAIEAALHSGDLCGVAATNALELGIDIGGLDVTLHLSFPGTVASLWQQAGRAGRREQTSLSIYVAFDGPLDQHFMRNPRKLFSRTIETPQVNPANAVLLQQHLVCAATELPLVPHLDHHFFGPAIHPCVAALCDAMKLVPTPGAPGAFHYIGGHARPAASVSLRTIDPDHFCIINEANGETLEQIEACKAFFEVYDGAVYLFHGRPYLCKRLDLTTRVAHVVAADVRYYTKPVHNRDVHVTGSRLAYTIADRPQFGRTSARVGPAVVTERFMAFVRIWRGSGIAFDRVDLFLPDIQFTTEAAYVRVPPSARAKCEEAGVAYREGLHAAGHAMVNVLPLFMSCNPADMRAECDNPYATRFRPERLLMYDSHPGGLGLSAEAGPMFTGMLREALQLITRCDCTEETGCPSCIHFSCCDAYNATLSKQAAVIVLAATLQQELGPEEPGSSGPGEVQDVDAAS